MARWPGRPGWPMADERSGGGGRADDRGPVQPIPRAAEPAEGTSERRGPDRRMRRTPLLSRFVLRGGRRRDARRDEEREGSYVDLYPRSVVLILVWVVLMNAADSYFTLVHLQRGGTELNPIADALLRKGMIPFVAVKSLLVALALLVLCLHKNFRVARAGLWVAGGAYSLLVLYHLFLFLV